MPNEPLPEPRRAKLSVRYCCCWLYAFVLLAASLVDGWIAHTVPYGDRSSPGCNFYDALLYGIECRGFAGSGVAENVLGLPLLVAQVSAMALSWPLMLLPAAVLWFPVLYLLYGAWKGRPAARKTA